MAYTKAMREADNAVAEYVEKYRGASPNELVEAGLAKGNTAADCKSAVMVWEVLRRLVKQGRVHVDRNMPHNPVVYPMVKV